MEVTAVGAVVAMSPNLSVSLSGCGLSSELQYAWESPPALSYADAHCPPRIRGHPALFRASVMGGWEAHLFMPRGFSIIVVAGQRNDNSGGWRRPVLQVLPNWSDVVPCKWYHAPVSASGIQ